MDHEQRSPILVNPFSSTKTFLHPLVPSAHHATLIFLNVSGLCEKTFFDVEYTMILGDSGYGEHIRLRIKYNLENEIWMIQTIGGCYKQGSIRKTCLAGGRKS